MPRQSTLRLASYNIQKCVGLDLRRQPRRILTVLDRLGAQIVVLQEADKRLPPRPAALPHFVLNEAGWKIADLGGAGSLGWHGNAVIWKGGGIRLTGTAHHDLPGFEPRGAVRAEFDTPIGRLRVVGLHLGLFGPSRQQQVSHLTRDMARLPDLPTVWAGDFNEWSRQPVLDHLAPQMRFLPPMPSFPAPQPVGPLDRIALGAGLAASAHGVHSERPAHIASDHLPVWADLRAAD
ncbi:Metal-dependent hydrolase, endonuclease/exonuclease/phosphatase family [Cribrihabitans marinus]|uniref:Metal-dependent hydrolase, endonuclease/exonuclease/phosphatase family n=1 Tax=Cribrihabitans marinus TaxID=1227549 RepID=A0A1H6QQM2_9RHOB|nr:endonuclease/exonuclease/phosphatase family protein [Cribrihabitans marinus]GGH19597.1 diguanylate cyclase [Cribrihabitans marinus]SEI45899.1 Metal-dependent hydrolase, endonuclease/exonuclease/phosphatase family [Cribrihabitans marinus]